MSCHLLCTHPARHLAQVEKPTDDVILRGIGRAINKVVTLAEIIKRQVPQLHQVTSIGSSEITDVFPPTEDGAEAYANILLFAQSFHSI
jgi:DNA-binding protein